MENLSNLKRDDLRKLARQAGLTGKEVTKLGKAELIAAITDIGAAAALATALNAPSKQQPFAEFSIADVIPQADPAEPTETFVNNVVALNDFINSAVEPAAKPATGKRAVGQGRIIEVLVANPKREGSQTYARFNLYQTGMTVGEFLAAGGKSVDIAWDEAHGFIKVR
jgi:hypothetical protein